MPGSGHEGGQPASRQARDQAADLRQAVQDVRELDADVREAAADQREDDLDRRDRATGDETADRRAAQRGGISRRHDGVLRARAAGERDRSDRQRAE